MGIERLSEFWRKNKIVVISIAIVIFLIGTALIVLNTTKASGEGWSLTVGGTLTVSVDGDMEDYVYNSDTDSHSYPWNDYSQNIKKVVIKPGVTSIGDNAFVWCYRLKRAVISDTVISIGNMAFKECHSLKRVKMPDSLTFIGDEAFAGCDALKKITIPDSVLTIGNKAFDSCDVLESITIPDSVISIGEMAFCQSIGLENVVISSGVSSIGEAAFDWCPSLVSITVDENNSYFSSEDGVLFDKNKTVLIRCPEGKKSDRYTIPDSVVSIGDNSFESCDNIKSIEIPDSVVSIGNYVFSCGSLEKIAIPASVTSIGTWEYGSCHSLVDITVDENNNYYSSEDGVLFDKNKTAILKYPMNKTENEYIIPDSVTSIGNNIFYECDNLKSVVIPDSVISIGDKAFSDCGSLENIIIPNSVTSIGENAFNGCYSLKSITISASVSSIEKNAFSLCDDLTITCPAGSYAEEYAIENAIPYVNN